MTKTKSIKIAKDYSVAPAGRFISDGPNSGEKFRNEILAPALREYDEVTVIIDDVEGYGSSFLEECFGGLIRELNFNKKEIHKKIKISYQDEAFKIYADMIEEYIRKA